MESEAIQDQPEDKIDLKPGETFSYRGYTIVKLDPHDRLDPQDTARLQADWQGEVKRFLQDELGADTRAYDEYLSAQNRFDEYHSIASSIEDEVTRKFGPGFAIVLEGHLKSLSEASNKAYDCRLSEILGQAARSRFEELKADYRNWALSKFGNIPNIIR